MKRIVCSIAALGLLLAAAAAPYAQSAASHAAGIYLQGTDAGGAEQLTPLPTAFLHNFKQKGMFKVMLTQGLAKPDMGVVLDGAAATLRTSTPSPVFVFYFDADAGSRSVNDPAVAMAFMAGGMPPSATTPSDFVLIPVKPVKGNKREAWFGANNGEAGPGRSKSEVPVTVEEIGPHAFKVQPKEPLQPGEYGFYFAGAQGALHMWDFGVDGK